MYTTIGNDNDKITDASPAIPIQIPIASLFETVKDSFLFRDSVSLDVLKHFGKTRDMNSFTKDLKYSDRDYGYHAGDLGKAEGYLNKLRDCKMKNKKALPAITSLNGSFKGAGNASVAILTSSSNSVKKSD